MKLYRAETGKRVLIPQLRPNDGLDTLRLAIEKATRIPQGSQILMTSQGLQLKADMMFEAITSTGKDEYTIMVYNREVLTTDISSSILTLTDHAKTEPTITPLPASLLQPISIPSRLDASSNRECVIQFQRMFEAFVTHVMACYKAIVAHAGACERIMEELRMQALAVQVALTNLDAHSRSVLETFEKFNVLATKEFSKQARLLQSFPRDIEALRQIKVHPALLPADSPERYISDFIPTEKLILWAERCRETHEALLRDGKDLSLSIKEVQEGTEAIKNNSGINLDQLEDSMAEILQTVEQQSQIRQRVERDQTRVREKLQEVSRTPSLSSSAPTLESLSQLANVYKTDYIDSSQKADGALREKLAIFISAKRSQTANLISQLMHISKLQSTIANIPLSLSNLDDALGKRETDFSQLVYVQRIPIAYGALIVEIVRRREYSKLLLQKSQQLAEVMSRFRQLEQRRRDSFRSEVAKFVPVVVPGLDDVPPFCEINALHTRDRLPPFSREQVVEFERLVSQLSTTLGGPESEGYTVESMAGGASSISSGQESYQDALSKLRVTMVKMTTQMDVMGGEFDRILEKSFYSDRIQRLEEENARLRADMSRTDVQQQQQQHPGTPLLSQAPFPRHGTPVGGAGNVSTGLGSTSAQGVSTIAPTSPRLSRQPSRGIGSSGVTRVDSEEHQQAFQQQAQQNQRLAKENSDLLTKIKAYEGRIRSLEETLYQNYRAGTGVDSSVSGKDSKLQASSQSPDDSQLAKSLSQARGDRKRDEEKIRALEQELTDTDKKMEQVETRLRNEYTVSQQAMTVNDELRQEILELKLQYATVEEQSDAKTYDREVILRRSDELEEELKGMNIKCEHLLEHHEIIKREHDLETKAFKDRIDELANQSTLEKEILEGQLEQARRTAEETSERVTELENELAVVNEELQNKVLELEEELETHTTQHEEVKARAEELEKQLDSHRAVHTDILVLLKEQEQKTATAEQNARDAKDEQEKQKETLTQLETDHDQVAKQLEAAEKSKEELAQQTETLRKQNSELEAQWESYKIDVNLRLEEAKSMVRRAEEDWKEKSRLLDQMERGIHDLGEPIRECTRVLGQEEDGLTMSPTLDIVKTHMQAIGQGIKELVLKHESDLAKEKMLHKEQQEELVKEHETSQQTLQDMVESLKKTSCEAEEGAVTQRTRLESAIDHLKEELELIKIQHQDQMKTPVVTTTITTACADEDRQLLASLSLDLGIALPSVSEEETQSEVLSPSSSVLFDNTERRQKSPPSMAASTLTPSGSSATTAGSSSRSSSAIVPLSKDILDTFDYAELDVTKTVALIKKRFYDTEHLLRRWQRECRHLKDKYNRASAEAHEKIAFRNFKVDDLTLFLPTRNSISKPWAAFNINFPHYFLQMTPSMANQLRNREWIVARITSITEAVVDKRVDGSGTGEEEEDNGGAMASSTLSIVSPNNPFGLADGVKYYLLEATSWNGYHGHGKSASSYHSSSTSGSSSSKLRHHASTSALAESSSSLSRHRDRRERESETGERRRHRDRPEVREEESSQSSRAHREALLEESSLNVRVSTSPTSSSTRARDSRDFSLAAVTGAGMGTGTGEMARSSTPSAASSSLMSLLRSSNSSGHLNRDSQSTTTALSATTVSPSSAGIAHEETGRAAAGLQQTQTQRMRHMRHESRDRGSLVFGEGEGEGEGGALSSSLTGTNVVGHRNSIGASGSLPISIPFQSAATSALRAISSSVGSTGSTGSGSGAGTGSGSVSGTTLAASSPPRTMIMSSSPHRTSVTTVSAVGTTVSVNPSSGGGNSASSVGTGSPNMGSSLTMSTAPVHPSRLSMSSHRDDFEQEQDTQQQQQQQQEDEGEHFAVFATDEDQERQRTRGFNRTMSSTSTWHGLPAEDL